MLVLSRKEEESIWIADSIEIKVLGIRGDRVKLGIRCDRTIPVHRHEVMQRIGPQVQKPVETRTLLEEPCV